MTKLKLKIVRDDSPEDPRKGFENIGRMVCWHTRYTLGDEQPKEAPAEWLETDHPGSVKLPLFLIDHSGLTMRTHDFSDCDPGGWDSGQVGWIVATPDAILASGLTLSREDIEKVKEILVSEVKQYAQYLEGDVWGFTLCEVETCNLGHEHEKVIESCWGFYGDDDLIEAIRDYIPEEAHGLLEKAYEDRA